MTSEEDISNLQAVCDCSKQRALELLEAASGVVGRAVEIHLQQQVKKPSRGLAPVFEIDDKGIDEDVVDISKKADESDAPPKKKQRANGSKMEGAASPGSQKKKTPTKKTQPTISSFFTPRKEVNGKGEPSTETGALSKEQPNTNNGKIPASAKSTIAEEPARARKPNALSNSPAPPKSKNAPHKPAKRSAPKQEPSPEKPLDPRLSYETLAKALAEITSTTKRNAKLNMLKTTIKGVIEALGGIHGDSASRKQDAQTLTCALELMSGKISLENDTVTPTPLQVSGAAASSAVQLVTGGVSRSRLREAYRKTGDLGDVAAEFFTPAQSVKNFFVPRNQATTDTAKEASSKSASLLHIHRLLQSIASVPKGTGSQKQRHSILVKLLRLSTTKDEMRFLVRTLLGNMRLGATMKSLLAGLTMAVQEAQTRETSTQEPAIQTVQRTFDICPRVDRIALSLLCGGVERMVEECTLEVGVPIQPSLANPAHSLEEVEKFMSKEASSELSCFSTPAVGEWKYDGVRCQAHFDGTRMRLFSRHLIDNTLQYPDASQYMLEARKDDTVSSFIIDAEIVGVQDDRLLPFQILSTRRGIKDADSDSFVQIRVFAFDLMFMNGASLIKQSLWERQKLLRENFKETNGFTFASSQEFAVFDEKKITTYLRDAVKGGAEGLMMKLTGSPGSLGQPDGQGTDAVPRPFSCPYESGTRSSTWLKLKRDYVSGFADTLDVVPIGAWYGNGRKAEKGFLSPILFAVYDEDDGVFRSISRCMSFTDGMYTAIREFYFRGTPYPADVGLSGVDETGKKESNATEEAIGDNSGGSEMDDNATEDAKPEDKDEENDFVGVNCFPGRPSTSVYVTNESPSIWFQPKEVWEVSFADLTLSRTHTAAAGLVDDPECRGVALRFPRFKRRRPDKGVEQATTSVQIAQLFTNQFKQH